MKMLRFLKSPIATLKEVWRKLQGVEHMERCANIEKEVRALPLDEARSLALSMIANEERFTTVRARPDAQEMQALEALPPIARAFFEEYDCVAGTHACCAFHRDKVGPAEFRAGFIRIGRSIDFTELVVHPGSDVVYEIDGMEESDEELKGSPSIYHQIVLEEQLVRDELLREPTTASGDMDGTALNPGNEGG